MEARATASDSESPPENEAPGGTVRAFFICENGEGLTVDFDRKRDLATVRKTDGLAFDLPRISADIGYVYRSGRVELRGADTTARWTSQNLPPTHCRSVD